MSTYQVSWKGLDQGVEHTWRPEVILEGLKSIATHSPVKHRDPESPFYSDMERLFPDKTWRAYDSIDNSFRPVFRRSNTWKKLGLIVETNKEFSLSLSGHQLLSGQTTLGEIYSNVLRNHVEGEEKPFVILSTLLASINPSQKLTINQLVNLLCRWRPGDDLDGALSGLDSFAELPDFATRRRRINSMLKLLESMGSISLKQGQIEITERDALTTVASQSQIQESFYTQLPIAHAKIDADRSNMELTPKRTRTTIQRERLDNGEFEKRFISKASITTDPDQRLKLLERATNEHETTVNQIVSLLENNGFNSFENVDGYDLFTPISEHEGYLFEVKSVHRSNYKKQIREAVAQLLEYRYTYRDELTENVLPVIVLNRDPSEFIDDWIYEYLESERGILLMWIDSDGKANFSPISNSPLADLLI